LEEGGFLLLRFAQMNCPLCGATPANQTHDHGLTNVEVQRRAVALEITKTQLPQFDPKSVALSVH
jgi:hypothetical protein